MRKDEALRKANEMNMDLVVIAEKAQPPVAKILDFNKFLYDERKKASAIKAKSKKSELKEFVFGPTIGSGDIDFRVQRAKEFLEEGNRVKITVKFKGRENEHPEVGFDKINKFKEELKDVARVESEPRRAGSMLTVTFVKL
ncbi:MAG: Translation initiation factor IF-3 [candidate division WWE3 bacterium GW2011_GWA1_41_8]|uniref:Translation initiation factor IF-3 n=2 Tax=Katanobacteria TaxID=422282 RepID=A0A0G0ZF12_UNCKA|nr:MAG: Translation initiation factor IF-3 [candidate division WWE3 bacterium GW2011_GWB1_41_6]KKS20626.1 MAG: Translation initiation factor IF-3 [candidate division WWE3 bacterium GW2011_GWA1_41_8]